jgi:hypothetical protein
VKSGFVSMTGVPLDDANKLVKGNSPPKKPLPALSLKPTGERLRSALVSPQTSRRSSDPSRLATATGLERG